MTCRPLGGKFEVRSRIRRNGPFLAEGDHGIDTPSAARRDVSSHVALHDLENRFGVLPLSVENACCHFAKAFEPLDSLIHG